MTELVQGLVLGAIQGIVEWLPISSEGVNTLILVHFFDKPVDEAIIISIWLHLGTLLAAVIYFRNDVINLLRHFPQYVKQKRVRNGSEQNSLITFLIISTIISGVLGAPLLFFSLELGGIQVGTVMAIIGVFLIISGLVQRYAHRLSGIKVTPTRKDALLLGVAQSFSVLPGLSRSGLTVSALLFRGYEGKQALRLSFLMSIPVVLVAEIGLVLTGKISFELANVISIIPAFIFGIVTIGILMRLATRIAFWKFCIFLGVISLLPLLIAYL